MSINVKSNLVLKRSFAFKVCELAFSNKNIEKKKIQSEKEILFGKKSFVKKDEGVP